MYKNHCLRKIQGHMVYFLNKILFKVQEKYLSKIDIGLLQGHYTCYMKDDIFNIYLYFHKSLNYKCSLFHYMLFSNRRPYKNLQYWKILSYKCIFFQKSKKNYFLHKICIRHLLKIDPWYYIYIIKFLNPMLSLVDK